MTDEKYAYKGYQVALGAIYLPTGGGMKMRGFYPSAEVTRSQSDKIHPFSFTGDEQRFDTRQGAIEYAKRCPLCAD